MSKDEKIPEQYTPMLLAEGAPEVTAGNKDSFVEHQGHVVGVSPSTQKNDRTTLYSVRLWFKKNGEPKYTSSLFGKDTLFRLLNIPKEGLAIPADHDHYPELLAHPEKFHSETLKEKLNDKSFPIYLRGNKFVAFKKP
jgi:hypothetical protein